MDNIVIAHVGHPFQQRQISRAYKPLKRDIPLLLTSYRGKTVDPRHFIKYEAKER